MIGASRSISVILRSHVRYFRFYSANSVHDPLPRAIDRHVCEFQTLTWAAMSIGDMEQLAGVVDREVLWSAARRAFKNPSLQYRKLMDCLRLRIAQRYHRGELLDAE